MAAKKPVAPINNVTLSVTGAITANASVTKGTSLRAALTANGGHKSSQFTFVDEAGKPVSIDRKLSGDLNVVATAIDGTSAAVASAVQTTTTERASGTVENAANTPKAGESDAAAAAAEPAAAEPAAPTELTITVSGSISGTFKATAGTTLREAIKKAMPDSGYSQQSYTDAGGIAVGLDRKLTQDYTLTASRRVSGG